ncbi:MAG: HisS family protein, partial [Planctomycetaceae bacterium]
DLFEALGFERFTVNVNNRQVLNGLLDKLGLAEKTVGILRALDKLAKIGADGVIREMTEAVGLARTDAEKVLELAALEGAPAEILARLETLLEGSDAGLAGVAKLRELFAAVETAGIPPQRIALDVSIARGLDYYTGTIYETFLGDLPGIGSVCSGGRYDDLAGLFTNQPLPGVGASLGLDRLLAAMQELGLVAAATTPAQALVTMLEGARVGDYLRIGRDLRRAGIDTEVYPEAAKLAKQFKYADRRGIRLVLIAGADEFASGTWQVKDLASGTQRPVEENQLADCVRALLDQRTGDDESR